MREEEEGRKKNMVKDAFVGCGKVIDADVCLFFFTLFAKGVGMILRDVLQDGALLLDKSEM